MPSVLSSVKVYFWFSDSPVIVVEAPVKEAEFEPPAESVYVSSHSTGAGPV